MEIPAQGWGADRCLTEAERLLADSRPAEAIPFLRQAAALRPTDPYPLCQIGVALLDLGSIDEALQAADEAIEASDNEWAHRLKAAAYRRLGRGQAAIAEAEVAVRLAPDSILNKELLLDLLVQARMFTPAEVLVSGLLKYAPRNPRYLFIAGGVALEKMQWSEAERYLRQSVELEPGNERAWNNLGLALSRQGKTEESISAFGNAARFAADWRVPRANLERALDRRAGIAGLVAFFVGTLVGIFAGAAIYPGRGGIPVLTGLATGVVAMLAAFALTRVHFRRVHPDLAGLEREARRSSRFRRVAYIVYMIGSLPAAAGLALVLGFVPVIGPYLAGAGFLLAFPLWRFGAPTIWRRWVLPRLV